MRLVSMQFVFFFNGVMERPDQKYQSINNRLNNLFNGYPTILPYAEGMPVDFPIVQLKSTNGKYSLNMAKSRCDFIISLPLVENIEDELKQFKLLVTNINTELTNMKFSRIAIISRYLFEVKNAVSFISEKFIKKDLKDLVELKIRYNKRKIWLNTQLNDITDISNVNYTLNGHEDIGVYIERDVNTIPELMLNVSKKEVDKFIEDNINLLCEDSIVEILKWVR